MTNWEAHGGSQNVCPSCRTRLRVSRQAESGTTFDCPECGTELVARRTGNGEVEVSTATAEQEPTPPNPSASRIKSLWTSNSRTIAAVVTASFGILLVIYLTTSDGEPIHRPDRESAKTASTSDAQTVDVSEDSNRPAGEAGSSAPGTTPARTVNSNLGNDSPLRPRSAAPSGNDATSPKTAEPPDSELASTILNEPPIALSLPTSGNDESTRPVSSVQLTAGTQETDRPNPQGPPVDNDAAAKADGSKVPNPTPTKKKTPKPMTVHERLEISISRFRQANPVPLRELIRTVEQLCRVRVDVSAASDELLETPVTLSLTKTTPSAILTEAGRKSGLRAIVDDDSVRLVPTEE